MKKHGFALAGVILISVFTVGGWNRFLKTAASSRMVIIEDDKGDRIAVEPTNDEVWNKLVELYHSKDEMWIGGAVEVLIFIRPDPNYRWGFRFKPETVTVAEVTAEGLQTTIRDISDNLDYWLNIGQAYVFAEVVNYSLGVNDLNGDGTINIADLFIVANAFGTKEGDPNYTAIVDIDNNSEVEIVDLYEVAKDYGKTV